MSKDSTYGLQNLGFTLAEADALVRRAVAMFSEQTNSKKRIEYLGQINETQRNDAIVVSMVPGMDPEGQNALARETSYYTGSVMNSSTIQFYQRNDANQVRNWQFTSESNSDINPEFVTVLMHELGHAFANLRHPAEGSCYDSGQVTMMRPALSIGAEQTVRDQDKLNVEQHYGRRSVGSAILRRNWQPSTSSWSTAASSPLAQYALTRMSSSSQNYPSSILVWLTADDPNLFSLVRLKKIVWSNSSYTYPETISVASRSASGVAVNPSNQQALWAYLKPGPITDKNRAVCYRLSTNGGQTFGATEFCPGFNIQRNFVAAAYDPRSSTFIISWVNDLGLLQFLTIPSTGSSVPSFSTVLTPPAWFGPTVACKNATNGCRIAFGSRGDAASCFKWIETQVELWSGAIQSGTLRTNCYHMHDAPTIAYFQQDNTYRRAFMQGNGGSYAASLTATGTVWQGMPDVYNGVVHSPAVYSTERICYPWACEGTLRAWILRW